MLNKNLKEFIVGDLSNKKILIIQAKFNKNITDELTSGVIKALKKYNIPDENIDIFYVPGTFEIPYMISKLIESYPNVWNGIICIGCLIKGESDHYDSTRIAVTNQLCALSCQHKIPIVNGVLNVHNLNQALERSGLIDEGINLGMNYAHGLCQMWIEFDKSKSKVDSK